MKSKRNGWPRALRMTASDLGRHGLVVIAFVAGCNSQAALQSLSKMVGHVGHIDVELPEVLSGCDAYRDAPDAFGYCITSGSQQLATAAEVDRLCRYAGELESDCRRAWVVERGPEAGWTLAQVLAACGKSADCALEALDMHGSADVVEQIGNCRRYGGSLARDCAVHALARWWGAGTDAQELGRLASQDTGYPMLVAAYAAAGAVCGGLGYCLGTGEVKERCEELTPRFQGNMDLCRDPGPAFHGPDQQ